MRKAIVKKTFDNAARDYDRIKVQIVPKYREAERLIQGYIDFPDTKRFSILELGTGTGSWASRMLKRFPKAQYYGIDFSEKMLETASHKLKRYADRIDLWNLDLNRESLSGRYDLIYTAFTLHHVEDKRSLFKVLHGLLKKNGIFLFMDVTIAGNPKLEARFMDSWKQFMYDSEWPNSKIRTIIDDHLKNDLPETVARQFEFLKDAGFSGYDVIWRYEKFTAFHAVK